MRVLMFALLALFLPALSTGLADSKPADYLTDTGNLKETLDVRDLQGGFAGFTGRFWIVAPDGSWTSGAVFNTKLTTESSGKLSKEQVAKLAEALGRYDLLSIKNIGKPSTNPHVVRVGWGKVSAEFSLKTTAPLPKADPATPEGRFAGIVAAVKSATKGAKE